jgi:N-acetylmuramidase
MWYAAKLFAAIESDDHLALWGLLASLDEYDAVAAATSLGYPRLKNLLYRNTRRFSVVPYAVATTSTPPLFVSPKFAAYLPVKTPLETLLPAVLAQGFKDRAFLGVSFDQEVLSRVTQHLLRLHSQRAIAPTVDVFRDVTRTLAATPAQRPVALTEADYTASAQRLGVEIPAIKAVALVESRGDAFDGRGRPKIMYEGHWFRKFTNNRYDLSHPHLSFGYARDVVKRYQSWNQYSRLYEAMVLDPQAAIKASSWGKFQVMGFNHAECGYSDVVAFARAMQTSESSQLQAFEAFCASKGLIAKLKDKDWAAFANGYNGGDSAANNYDAKMKEAYDRFVRESGNAAASVRNTPNVRAVNVSAAR